jgi:autotransporter-associated beta strand protein
MNGIINLGTGRIVKEGTNQVTLNQANVFSGGTVIRYGPNLSNAGAIRINAAAGYGAFGSGDIVMENTLSITALYFDNGAGSGTLANNIKLQTTTDGINTRISVDAASNFDVVLSGLISGGHSVAQLVVDNDSNTDLGRLHLTNSGNTFLASNVYVARGALVVYGDGSLGNATNDMLLDVDSVETRTGLHFGADTTLNSSRTVRVERETVIHTAGYEVAVQGEFTGEGAFHKHGTGSLLMAGNNTTYGGGIQVHEGTLVVNGYLANNATSDSFLTVESGATLRGLGTIERQVTLKSGAVLSAGGLPTDAAQGIGQITVLGELTLDAGSQVDFHLGEDGHDKIVVGSNPFSVANGAAGARFKIVLDYIPAGVRQFDLLDWGNLDYSGTDLAAQLDLPLDILADGLYWDTSRFHSDGVLSIAPEPSRAVLLLLGLTALICRRGRGRVRVG